MSLMEAKKVKTKSELVKTMSSSMIDFVEELEPVDEAGVRKVAEVLRALIRNKRSVHVVLLEKKRGRT